jgi:hypothetical protein
MRRAAPFKPRISFHFLPLPINSKLERDLSTLHRSHHGPSLWAWDDRSPAGAHATKTANTTARGKGRKRKRGDNGRGAQAQAPDDDDNDGPAPVHVPIFPKLTSLLLEMLDFTDAVPGSGVLYDLVLSASSGARRTKTPLTTLCIDDCVIRRNRLKRSRRSSVTSGGTNGLKVFKLLLCPRSGVRRSHPIDSTPRSGLHLVFGICSRYIFRDHDILRCAFCLIGRKIV